MKNEYVVSEVVEIGSAENLILDNKSPVSVDDNLGGIQDAIVFDE